MKHVHLIGIGGTGLSAIARVLLESGYLVSGSDQQNTPLAASLAAAGARVHIGHHASQINGADVVVRSSAVPEKNVEVQAALSQGIPVVKRDQFLSTITADKTSIAIAGTHGKTTTTAMLAWILVELGMDPSFILGSVISGLEVNARAGEGETFVIEADEYDRMFLGLNPEIAVVTNIEHDHPDCFPTPEEFQAAFRVFIGRIKPDGALILCGDDPGASTLLPAARRRGLNILTYGIHSFEVDFAASELRADPGRTGYSFQFYSEGQHRASVELQVPGTHNILNAMAALVVVDRLNLPLQPAAKALSGFRGTGRRFEIIGKAQGVTVVSDYAHHPTEIKATLSAARSRYPDSDIWAVWQPHTYSRTKLFFDDFAGSFQDADHVLVTEIYPAREKVEVDYSASQFISVMNHPDARFTASLSDAVELLTAGLDDGDVLVVLSAGDANQVCKQVLDSMG